MKECLFCAEGRSFSVSRKFLGDKWPYSDRIVFFDSNVFAVAGYGPQVIPYILIVPYRHINSMAEMNMEERTSLLKCLDFLCGRGGYGRELTIFEHGGKPENSSASIDHCHVHVIDGKWKLFEKMNWNCFEYIDDFREMKCGAEDHYLLAGKYSSGKLSIKITTEEINEHQYFRKRLAEVIGDAGWNWKENMNFESMVEIMRLFKGDGEIR